MYEIENEYIIDTNQGIITANKKILLEYDGYDILYYGNNGDDNLVMGSLSIVNEDDELYFERYINTILTEKQLKSFFNKEISYREILEDNKEVYVIDIFGAKILQTYIVPIINIPEEYLPSIESFYDEEFIQEEPE